MKALNEEFSNYEQNVEIFNSLSDEEKLYITDDMIFKKSPRILYSYTAVVDNKPIGFIEVYLNNNDGRITGFLILAVIPSARRHGLGKLLVKKAIKECKKRNVSMIIYKVYKSNYKSKNLIESLGFKFERFQEGYYIYELTL